MLIIVYDWSLQLIALFVASLLLSRSSVLMSSWTNGVSGRKLVLSLLVSVRDEAVQERAWSASRVVLSLCGVDLAVKVAGGLIVGVLVLVVVVVLDCAMSMSTSSSRL